MKEENYVMKLNNHITVFIPTSVVNIEPVSHLLLNFLKIDKVIFEH